jgi:hypothetical protein
MDLHCVILIRLVVVFLNDAVVVFKMFVSDDEKKRDA